MRCLSLLQKPPIDADKQLAVASIFLETDGERENAVRSALPQLFQLAATYTARMHILCIFTLTHTEHSFS